MDPLFETHRKETAGFLEEHAARFSSAHDEARRALLGRLVELGQDGALRFESHRPLLLAYRAGLVGLRRGLKSALLAAITRALPLASNQALDLTAARENRRRFAAGASGRVQTAVRRGLEARRGPLQDQARASIDRHALYVLGDAQRRLAGHVARGGEGRRALLEIAGRGVVSRERALLVFRTEIALALNAARQAAIEALAPEFEDLKRRLEGDDGGCDACRAQRGRVVGAREPLFRGAMGPPLHPGCGCEIWPYRAAWEGKA